jgi:hypothetical protein
LRNHVDLQRAGFPQYVDAHRYVPGDKIRYLLVLSSVRTTAPSHIPALVKALVGGGMVGTTSFHVADVTQCPLKIPPPT